MPTPSVRGGPSPLRWLIAVELARHRDNAGLTMTQVSARVGMTKAKLGHLETGRLRQSPADIASLLTAYNVDRDTIDRLAALTERADEALWWTGAAHAVPDWFRIFVGLERVATREFVHEPTVITGLLQTEAYARALAGSSLLTRPPDIERMVELRMSRARRLTDPDDPLTLHAVLAEATLHLQVGDRALWRAQLQHLAALAERPNVTIQVVRPEDGYHDAHSGRLMLLDFEEVRSIGYTETIDGAFYVQDPDQVRTCTLVMEQLCRLALDAERSLELIRSLVA